MKFEESWENGLDLNLFGQLFLAEFVQGVELTCQGYVFKKSTGCQFYANNDLTVRDHHSNSTELNFQIFSWEIIGNS